MREEKKSYLDKTLKPLGFMLDLEKFIVCTKNTMILLGWLEYVKKIHHNEHGAGGYAGASLSFVVALANNSLLDDNSTINLNDAIMLGKNTG